MALSQSIAALGNQNKSPARPFSDTLRTVLFEGGKKRMNAVVHALVAKAEEGDIAAVKEIADRIEGKVITQVSVSSTHTVIDADLLSEAGKLLQLISGHVEVAPLVEIVDPSDSEEVENNGQT